jgi:hypothetical protein
MGLGVSAAGASGHAAADADASGSCPGATLTREYTAQAMTWRLRLDLNGCRWWDGSARNPVVWLSRDDGTGPASRYSMTPCESTSDPNSARTTTCEVFAALPHQSAEQAVAYEGEATWDWKGGPRRVAFSTTCTTTPAGEASCADPVTTWHD